MASATAEQQSADERQDQGGGSHEHRELLVGALEEQEGGRVAPVICAMPSTARVKASGLRISSGIASCARCSCQPREPATFCASSTMRCT